LKGSVGTSTEACSFCCCAARNLRDRSNYRQSVKADFSLFPALP